MCTIHVLHLCANTNDVWIFYLNYITAIAKCLPLKQICNSIDPLQQKVIEQQKPLKFKMLCSGAKDAGNTAQWQNPASHVWGPQFNTQYLIKKKKILIKTELPSRTLLIKENNIIFLLLFLGFPNNKKTQLLAFWNKIKYQTQK